MSYKKGILICFILIAVAFLPFLEYNLRLNACEPIPNAGGPNHPYCVTMIFSLFLTPGFIVAMIFGGEDLTSMHWVLIGFFSFIFYLLIYFLIAWIYSKIKKGE
jgi:hypothetical protein